MDENVKKIVGSKVTRTYEISSKFSKGANKTQAPKPSEIETIIKNTTKKEGE